MGHATSDSRTIASSAAQFDYASLDETAEHKVRQRTRAIRQRVDRRSMVGTARNVVKIGLWLHTIRRCLGCHRFQDWYLFPKNLFLSSRNKRPNALAPGVTDCSSPIAEPPMAIASPSRRKFLAGIGWALGALCLRAAGAAAGEPASDELARRPDSPAVDKPAQTSHMPPVGHDVGSASTSSSFSDTNFSSYTYTYDASGRLVDVRQTYPLSRSAQCSHLTPLR